MVPSIQRCCLILTTFGYAGAFVSRYYDNRRGVGPKNQLHQRFATNVPPDLDQLAKEWRHQVKEDETPDKLRSTTNASKPNHHQHSTAPTHQPRGSSNRQNDFLQLAEEWGAMNRDTDYRNSSKGTIQSSVLPSQTTSPPASTGSSVDGLAEAWIVANKDTDKFTDTPPMSTKPTTMHATPVPMSSYPKGSSGHSMDDMANAWASMNTEVDSFQQLPIMGASFKSANKAPTPSTGPSLDGLAKAWIMANKDTDKFRDTPPMSTASAPSAMQASPMSPPSQPKEFSGPSMNDLAKIWSTMNEETDSFYQPPPMVSPSVSHSLPDLTSSSSSSPDTKALAQAWASSNRDMDLFQSSTSPPEQQPGTGSLNAGHSGTPEYASPAASQIIDPPTSMPHTVVNWETLAAEWSSINKDMDTMYNPTPEMESLTTSENSIPSSTPSDASTEERSVNWENLANEWKAINTDIDRVVGTIQTVGYNTMDNAPNDQSDPLMDSIFDSLESSWNEMSQELDSINHEAKQTFEALQQMESEMNSMIDELHAREASYHQKLQQLQQDSSHKETQLLGQLQRLGNEFDAFKRDAEERRLAEVHAAEEGQRQLASQIAELKQGLAEKIRLAQQESELAQEHLAKYQESQLQLSTIQEDHKDELIQTVERLKPSTERLENVRRVTSALRSISQGTREIMARMREKLLVQR